MMVLTQRMETVLRSRNSTDGIDEMEHQEKPRAPAWPDTSTCTFRAARDANFVSVISKTRVMPEALEGTWERIGKNCNWVICNF